jgi:hypothetical protein
MAIIKPPGALYPVDVVRAEHMRTSRMNHPIVLAECDAEILWQGKRGHWEGKDVCTENQSEKERVSTTRCTKRDKRGGIKRGE